jgi:hypothetical protein
MPNWLFRPDRTDVALCVARQRLPQWKAGHPRVPRKATRRWMLDSGGFSELQKHGRWTVSPEQYAGEVEMWCEHIGEPDVIAIQDWMCERAIREGGTYHGIDFAGTGLSVREHLERTVQSAVDLTALMPRRRLLKVLQGDTLADYLLCADLYEQAGFNLTAEPVVGLGSVCRREDTAEIVAIVSELAIRGFRLHGFGVKTGIHRYGHLLYSADSTAWSTAARMDAYHGRPTGMPADHAHRGGSRNCANCFDYAVRWYDRHIERMETEPVQATLFEDVAGLVA